MAGTGTSAPPAPTAAPATGGQTYRGSFAIMTILFFMWGFMNVWNDILIPRLKEAARGYLAFYGLYGYRAGRRLTSAA